MGCVSVGAIP